MTFVIAMIVLLVAVGFGIWTAVELLVGGAYCLLVIAVWVYPVLFLVSNVVLPILSKQYISAIIYGIGFVLALVVILITAIKFTGWGIAMMILCELIAYKTT